MPGAHRVPRRFPTDRLLDLAGRLAPALGAGWALTVLARFSRVPDAEAAYLAIPALGVLAAAGGLALRRGWETPVGAILVTLAAWVLPSGPVRGAVVLATLAATLAAAGARRFALRTSWTPAVWVAWTFGVQFLLRSPRLFEPEWGGRLLGTFVGLPLVAAAALVWIDRRFGRGAALLAGLLTVLPDAGFSVRATLILALVSGLASIPRRRLVAVPGPALAVAGALGFAVALAASYPWLRADPWRSVLTGAWEILAPPAAPVASDAGAPAALTVDAPVFRLDGFDAQASVVILDTHLSNAAALAPGTPVATVRLKTEAGRVHGDWTLAAGVDTGEWAASRADVAAIAGFRAPRPWLSWIPPEGGFFAHLYRSRLETESPGEAAALSVVRRADLPAEVELVVNSAEVR